MVPSRIEGLMEQSLADRGRSRMLPGPVSKAHDPIRKSCGGIAVRFAIPPSSERPRPRRGSRYNNEFEKEDSGAPLPPAAYPPDGNQKPPALHAGCDHRSFRRSATVVRDPMSQKPLRLPLW